TRPFADYRLFGRFRDFDRLVLKGTSIRIRSWPIHRAAFHIDFLFMQSHLLFDWLFDAASVNANTSATDRSLSNLKLFFHDRNGPGPLPLVNNASSLRAWSIIFSLFVDIPCIIPFENFHNSIAVTVVGL